MYLKTVEIVGFKSFADKTRLDLKPGITGIIGPNGCGKSNVQEAIRWCIGEMSWKSLRSASMVDVIFAGTARRNPLGMAEVTLTFDNASGQLPVQYSEITVTRRLFRSGESEYYLNKTQCRLRDIKELFLDTGIGGDGYAIIDQGGVDFVLSAKPEDRRALFEEAAGVSKYKAKREEALRKLERVEADLARLSDSMALINEQIKKLDSDARKAKLYQKYKEELTALEAGQILQEAGAIAAELEREGALLEPVRQALESRRVELDAEQGRLAALNLELTSTQAQAAEAHQAIAEVRAEISRLDERLRNNEAMTADLRRRDADARVEIARDSERAAGLDPELDRAQAAVDAAASRQDSARRAVESFDAESAGLQARYDDASRELEALRARAMEAAGAAVETANALAKSESRLGHLELELRQALKDLGRQLEKAQACRTELEGQLAALLEQQQWTDASARVAASVESAVAALSARRGELERSIFDTRSEAVRLQAKTEALEAQGAQDAYWVGAQAAVDAQIPGVLGTVRSLLSVEDAFARPVEDALGERLYAVVCEDHAAARAAVDFLRDSGKGRARFLVLSSFSSTGSVPVGYPPEAKPLLDHVRFDARFEPVVRLLLAECYTLGGALYGEHWVCGGSEAQETLPLKLADIGALRRSIADLGRAEADLAAAKAEVDADLAKTQARLRAILEARQAESARLHGLEAVRRQKEESLSLYEREAELFREEAGRLLAGMASLREELGETRRALAERREREIELRANEAQSAQTLEGLKAEAAERRMRHNELESSLKVLQAQRELAQRELDGKAMEKESLTAAVERRRAELEAIAARLRECARTDTESRERLDAQHRGLAEHETRAQAFGVRLTEMTAAAQTLQGSIRALQEACAQAQDELHRWEIKASGLKARQDSLKGRLWDEWQLTWDEASAKYAQQPVDPDKLQTLRRRIQNMGNINMAAPEEYEALTQKHGFLKTQVDDLDKAKEDLRSAIAKINGTTRENFRQTFTEVREHFRRIYGSLFEGGEADLVLTDQENLLETGIEIVAQPPGKRLQSISLLSGGEKTLTAIALLFAFFMVKPSPVCMLDEADAALDEANTERFAAMLREFAGKSQFLIVSHSKRTMEAAEQIYGVTMEESGVTQMISVDFKKRGPGEPVLHRAPEPQWVAVGAEAPEPVVAEGTAAAPATEAVSSPAAEAFAAPLIEAVAAPRVESFVAPAAEVLAISTVETPAAQASPESAAAAVVPEPAAAPDAAPAGETPESEPKPAE